MSATHPHDDQTTVAQLKATVRDFCSARDWDRYHNPKDLAIGVITEASELLEHFRFQNERQQLELLANPISRAEIEAELADVLTFVVRFAERFDIDLASTLAAKLIQNARKYPVPDRTD
ncbi:MAG: nucleotide pyrophosphohydrolase [Pirellulales bacterium]